MMTTTETTGPVIFEPGDKVEHTKWGLGVIIHRTGTGENSKVIVLFHKEGQKTLMVKYAKLKKVGSGASIPKSGPAPKLEEVVPEPELHPETEHIQNTEHVNADEIEEEGEES